MREHEDWRHQAACLDEDPNRMQPEVASAQDVLEAIVDNCAGCPVRTECRQLALDNLPAYGIHGGQWFGDEPRRPGATTCAWCGGQMVDTQTHPRRSTSRYCSSGHRVAAHRARQAMSA